MSLLRRIEKAIQAFRYPAEPQSGYSAVYNKERDERELSAQYEKAVSSIKRKYLFLESKGAMAVRSIIDYRASAIAAGKISLSGEMKTTEILKDWFQRNNIYKKTIEFAKLAEREGRLAICIYQMSNGDLGLKAIPYAKYKYRMQYDQYGKVSGIAYDTKDGEYVISKPFLVYLSYANNDEQVGDQIIPPKIAYCLDDIEQIETQISHWSKVNEYFADPTPHFDTEQENFFDRLKKIINGQPAEDSKSDGRRWKIGQGIITWKTKLNYVQADLKGVESLDRNIQVRCQRISFMTGFPIYLLYPELMSNRATATEIAADTNNATALERISHQEFWTEVCQNICIISNQLFGSALNPDKLYVTLPQISAAQIKLLVETFKPIVEMGGISMRTFRELLPNVDPEEEEIRIREEQGSSIIDISKALLSGSDKEIQQ